MDAFAKRYKQLTEQQQRAVDAIEGPVLIVAGPGSGKTEVLALRIANILKRTHAKPGNILCLTFTTSGAVAMRSRLRELIGPDAYGVKVSTIHGYCNDVIASHPHVFESWSALEQISDLERYRTVNRCIDARMPGLALINPKDPYGRTKTILSAISLLKREGKVDPKELMTIADEYEEQMTSSAKEGTKKQAEAVSKAVKFREGMQLLSDYQKELSRSGRYDYEDMVNVVAHAFREHDWLLAEQQERYLYLCVDEAQDTNGAQQAVVDLLTTPRTPEDNPNLLLVGDDDQSIYRFQGANVTNLLRFTERFPKGEVIALTTSFRCTQQILDAAGSLIARNTERLVGKVKGLKKDLKSAKTKKGSVPQLLLAASDAVQPWLIADLIEERITQGVPPEEIAILTQTNAELRPIYDVLRAKGIPALMSGTLDLLSHRLVLSAIALLRAVENPENTAHLAAALGCDCLHVHPADLARCVLAAREGSTTLHQVLLSLDTLVPLAEVKHREALINARDIILTLNSKLPVRTVVETVERTLRDTGLLPLPKGNVILDLSNGESLARSADPFDVVDYAVLQEFFDRIKSRAYEQPEFDLSALLHDIDAYQNPDYDIRLSYELPHLTEKGVQLMTAHRSKGQEFQIVVLPNFREGHWDHRRPMNEIAMPYDLLFGWSSASREEERLQDERRVAYVAFTRAKEELLLVCPKTLTTGTKLKEVSPSAIVAEAGGLPEVDAEIKDPGAASLLLLPRPKVIDGELAAFLRHRLETFALSPTALQHFLDNPQTFLEKDLLQVPETKNQHMVYGSAVHDALRLWGMAKQRGDIFTEEQFVSAFEQYLRDRDVLTDKERKNLIADGMNVLPKYYASALSSHSSFVYAVEKPLQANLGNVPIKGKLDRIDLAAPDSSIASVIDAKTGKPKSPKECEDMGYILQLTFYALLLEKALPMLKPQAFVLDFVGERDAEPIQRSFVITESQKTDLAKTIDAVWKKVVALDFTKVE